MSDIQIQKVRYTHDAMIDQIILNPSVSQGELARHFGFSQGWVSIMINSDAFKERLAERKAEIVDPVLRTQLEEKLKGAANRALDKLLERLDNPGTAISTKDLVSIARLTGTPNLPSGPINVQNNYVMSMPPQAPDSQKWLENRMGGPAGSVVGSRTALPLAARSPLLDSDASNSVAELIEVTPHQH
jgi:hypothetical protein